MWMPTSKYRQRLSGRFASLRFGLKILAITTPQDGYPDSAVRVSKVSIAARTSPKS
jgi:hypothetical protein